MNGFAGAEAQKIWKMLDDLAESDPTVSLTSYICSVMTLPINNIAQTFPLLSQPI